MNDPVHMRILAACGYLAGMLAALALPAHAQSEPSAQSELSGKIDSSTKAEPAAQIVPAAPNASSIEAFVAKLDSATRAIHESSRKEPALLREGCRDLLSEMLDLNAMAQASNAEIWEQMTLPQRDTFRLAFEHRMVGNCVRQFGGYGGEFLLLMGVRQTDGGDLLATIRVGSQDDAKLVTWRLRSSRLGNWRAVDVITEGRSAVLDARTEFGAVLQSVNGDIDALITFMQK
jgi:ABC-type transporter MlaC component